MAREPKPTFDQERVLDLSEAVYRQWLEAENERLRGALEEAYQFGLDFAIARKWVDQARIALGRHPTGSEQG